MQRLLERMAKRDSNYTRDNRQVDKGTSKTDYKNKVVPVLN
jgi:hypothetical protein